MSLGTIVTDRAAWLAERKKGVGASEAAAALGVSPFESPRELYLRKLGILPEIEESEAMEEGSYMEPFIARKYEEKTGRKIVASQLFVQSDLTPLMATLDGMTDAGYPVELKWVTRQDAGYLGEEDTDEIPNHWLIQGHQQMLLSGTFRMDFAVKVAGRPLKVFTVQREEDLCEAIIVGVRLFWTHVKERIAPESDARADRKVMHLIYPGCEGEIELTEDDLALVEEYEEIGLERKEREDTRESCKVRLLERLGNHALGRLPDGREITRKVINVGAATIERKAFSYTSMRIKKGPRTT